MNKKTIKLLFLFIITIIIFQTNVYAKEGWQEENGNKYYYENDEKVSGFKIIDDKLYFFSRVNYALKTGWQHTEEGYWYQNSNGEVVKGLQKIDNNTYYFNENGIMQKGFVQLNDKLYFFSRVNGALKTGWQNASEGYWYQNNDGEVVKGLQKIDNNTYYFDENGIRKSGFIPLNDKLYFFSRVNGALKTGWQNASEGYWYQNSNGEVVKGLQKIDNNTYYFNENGIMQKGFVQLNDKLYFFSRVNGALKTGWQNASEGYWYQNNDGEVVKGLQKIDNNTYYFDENGIRRNGFITIDGKIYFFSKVTNTLKTGWQHTSSDTYWYQDENGVLVTGPQNIGGRDYKFSEETGLLEGFKKENNKLYYYDPDGTLNKGVQYMADQFFKFDANTGAFEKIVRQIRVIDISTHNGVIDWNKVKASHQVDGVILRLGYGQNFMDSRFLYNKGELERLGIPYSVYLFSYAENKTEAQKEADFVVRTIQNEAVRIASSIFAVYYDLEDWEIHSTGENSYGISQDTYGEMITTFVSTIENNLGVRGRVYASKNYIETRFPAYARDYATWVAQWNDTITYKGNYEGWQYSSTGSVPGINGNVDMNIFYY